MKDMLLITFIIANIILYKDINWSLTDTYICKTILYGITIINNSYMTISYIPNKRL